MITSTAAVRERMKLAEDKEHRETMYWLRLVVANYITGDGGDRPSVGKEGQFGDVVIKHWEEGRFNPISSNTQVALERLTANDPDFTWNEVPDPNERGPLLAAIRKAYFMWLWKDQALGFRYGMKLLDLITTGEANMGCFVRGDGVDVEWCDALRVGWDPAYKQDPSKRRYVTLEKPITIGEAVKYYPKIKKVVEYDPDKNGDKLITVKCFWDRDNGTEAVQFRGEFVHGPTENRYGQQLPIRATVLTQLPSVKHATGIVERQIGSQELDLRLQRYFRDTALRAVPIPYAAGGMVNEDQYEAIMNGDESAFLRFPLGGTFNYAKGAEIQATAIEVKKMVTQNLQAESGQNEFTMGQTGTDVNFASQLGYLAQQSSARERFLASRLENGLADDIQQLIMPIASRFEDRAMNLWVQEKAIEFGPFKLPIKALLGGDGKIVMKPGGMSFKSSAQALQETMIFANVVALANGLPPGLQERFVRMALKAAEIEDSEDWLKDMAQAQAALQAQQDQMIAQQKQMMQQQVDRDAMKGAVPQAQSEPSQSASRQPA